jgi:hypothetical protein
MRMMSDVVSSNSKNANNFNDLKKEYLKIQEEISEAKKSLNKINLILGELERSLKIKELKFEIANLERDNEGVSKLEKEIKAEKILVDKIRLKAIREKEKFKDTKKILGEKIEALEMDPYNKGKLDMALKMKELDKIENKKAKMVKIQNHILNNDGLKQNLKNMMAIYPSVLKYTQELNRPNIDSKEKESLVKSLYNVQREFYENQQVISDYIEKNNLDISMMDFDVLMPNDVIDKDANNIDVDYSVNRVINNLNRERVSILSEDERLNEAEYIKFKSKSMESGDKSKSDDTIDKNDSKIDNSKTLKEDSKTIKKVSKNLDNDDFEEVDLDSVKVDPERQKDIRKKINDAMVVKEDGLFKRLFDFIKNSFDNLSRKFNKKKMASRRDKLRKEMLDKRHQEAKDEISKTMEKVKQDKKKDFRDELVSTHKDVKDDVTVKKSSDPVSKSKDGDLVDR